MSLPIFSTKMKIVLGTSLLLIILVIITVVAYIAINNNNKKRTPNVSSAPVSFTLDPSVELGQVDKGLTDLDNIDQSIQQSLNDKPIN